MNFTSLDYFIALVQEKSYTKAAQRLHVTQQTLSAHIAAPMPLPMRPAF